MEQAHVLGDADAGIEQLPDETPDIEAGDDAAENKERIQSSFRTRKLRNPNLQAFFDFLRKDPALWEQVRLRNDRRDDFLHFASDSAAEDDKQDREIEEHMKTQWFKPYWSAAATVPEARVQLELAIDQACENDSERLKQHIESGQNYVQELIVGGGVHGAIFNSKLLAEAPHVSRLTIESYDKLGGQFRQYGGAVFAMNTSNRAVNADNEGVLDNPSANPFGAEAPVQLNDLSGRMYATNADVGLAAALNQYLSADTLLRAEVTKISKNNNSKQPGQFKATIRDTVTGELLEVFTDRVIVSTGIGTPDYGMGKTDAQTQEILDEEHVKAESGDSPQVMTYGEFLREVGDSSNPFPLDRFKNKKICIVGGGHSAFTVIEMLTGFGPEYRGSVSSLGYPARIDLIGSKYESGKHFQIKESPRYGSLSSFMDEQPQQQQAAERKNLIITPFSTIRAKELRRGNDGKIVLRCHEKESEDVSQEIESDIVIFTTGFSNNINEVLGELLPEKEGAKLEDNLDYITDADGVTRIGRCVSAAPDITFIGTAASMQVNDTQKKWVTRYNYPTGTVAIFNVFKNTEACASRIAHQENEDGDPPPGAVEKELVLPDFERQEVSADLGMSIGSRTYDFETGVSEEKLPYAAKLDGLLKTSVWATLKEFKLPESVSNLRFSLKKALASTDAFVIEPDASLPSGFAEVFDRLARNKNFQLAVYKYLYHSADKDNELDIVIPLKSSHKKIVQL